MSAATHDDSSLLSTEEVCELFADRSRSVFFGLRALGGPEHVGCERRPDSSPVVVVTDRSRERRIDLEDFREQFVGERFRHARAEEVAP